MKKSLAISVMIIGILLIINGFSNIIDDARVLCYDLTSILSGLGFLLLGVSRMIERKANRD